MDASVPTAFDHRVGAAAAGRAHNGVRSGHREGRGTIVRGTVPPAVHRVDTENRCGATNKRAAHGTQSDRAQSDYRHSSSQPDIRPPRGRPAGGQVVGEKQRLFGGDLFGDLEHLEVCGGHGE